MSETITQDIEFNTEFDDGAILGIQQLKAVVDELKIKIGEIGDGLAEGAASITDNLGKTAFIVANVLGAVVTIKKNYEELKEIGKAIGNAFRFKDIDKLPAALKRAAVLALDMTQHFQIATKSIKNMVGSLGNAVNVVKGLGTNLKNIGSPVIALKNAWQAVSKTASTTTAVFKSAFNGMKSIARATITTKDILSKALETTKRWAGSIREAVTGFVSMGRRLRGLDLSISNVSKSSKSALGSFKKFAGVPLGPLLAGLAGVWAAIKGIKATISLAREQEAISEKLGITLQGAFIIHRAASNIGIDLDTLVQTVAKTTADLRKLNPSNAISQALTDETKQRILNAENVADRIAIITETLANTRDVQDRKSLQKLLLNVSATQSQLDALSVTLNNAAKSAVSESSLKAQQDAVISLSAEWTRLKTLVLSPVWDKIRIFVLVPIIKVLTAVLGGLNLVFDGLNATIGFFGKAISFAVDGIGKLLNAAVDFVTFKKFRGTIQPAIDAVSDFIGINKQLVKSLPEVTGSIIEQSRALVDAERVSIEQLKNLATIDLRDLKIEATNSIESVRRAELTLSERALDSATALRDKLNSIKTDQSQSSAELLQQYQATAKLYDSAILDDRENRKGLIEDEYQTRINALKKEKSEELTILKKAKNNALSLREIQDDTRLQEIKDEFKARIDAVNSEFDLRKQRLDEETKQRQRSNDVLKSEEITALDKKYGKEEGEGERLTLRERKYIKEKAEIEGSALRRQKEAENEALKAQAVLEEEKAKEIAILKAEQRETEKQEAKAFFLWQLEETKRFNAEEKKITSKSDTQQLDLSTEKDKKIRISNAKIDLDSQDIGEQLTAIFETAKKDIKLKLELVSANDGAVSDQVKLEIIQGIREAENTAEALKLKAILELQERELAEKKKQAEEFYERNPVTMRVTPKLPEGSLSGGGGFSDLVALGAT